MDQAENDILILNGNIPNEKLLEGLSKVCQGVDAKREPWQLFSPIAGSRGSG